MKKSITCLFLSVIFSNYVLGQIKDLIIKQWQPYDFEFKCTIVTANPFAVNLTADVISADGAHITIPGFYNGEGIWKVRVSAAQPGHWSLITHSNVSGLDHQRADFTCAANLNQKVHGGLLIDPVNRENFIFQDGTHWFPLGYECNWLWALDADNEKLPVVHTFLDKLSGYGFNMVLVNAYAFDTTWRPGKSGNDDYGPSQLYPWGGSNDKPDFSHFNIAYWQHFDNIISALYQHGIAAHLYMKVYNKKVNWPANNSPEDDRYYQWLIARYAAYPNIIWDLAKEANYEKSVDYKTAKLKFIKAADPYHRLLTVHTDIQTYDSGAYNDLVDFRSHQEQSDHLHITALKQLNQKNWPVFNVESGYEQGPKGANDKTYNHAESAEEDIDRIWQIQMAGAYNAYYYTYTAWDVIRPEDTPAGYNYLKNFRDFFIGTKFWMLKPADELVSTGYCLADPGIAYIVYQPKAVPFKLNIQTANVPMDARWYNPYTGIYEDAGPVKKGIVALTPPAAFGNGPVVLQIRVKN